MWRQHLSSGRSLLSVSLFCETNICEQGQVAMHKMKDSHDGPPEVASGCWFGEAVFCCDPPLTNGSAFLPVPLENLFPDADSFPASYDTNLAIVVDDSDDQTTGKVPGKDMNKHAFAWIVMVGEEEDLQSFDKRDGSDLELFDCPDTHPDDYSIQKARAVCGGGEQSNCRDILKGGVEGTIVRMPATCGPDHYVRAVRFEPSSNTTLPGHLQKGYEAGNEVYDFHYDYDFRNLRRDGGEIHFRADLSTHPGYWDTIVAAPVKRDFASWRDIDRRWLAEANPLAWLSHLRSVFGKSTDDLEKTGVMKSYAFNQCIFDTSATCPGHPPYEIKGRSSIYGELNTTMDFGMTLIGTLKNFQFSEAFASFTQHEMSLRLGALLDAKSRLYFDTGYHNLGPFDSFGMGYSLKGIFTFNPYFELAARVEADAYISAKAAFEASFSMEKLRYYLPLSLASGFLGGEQPKFGGRADILSNGEIEAQAGAGLLYHIKPAIGFDIQLHLGDRHYVGSSIKLMFDNQLRVDVSRSTNCPEGLQVDIEGGFQLKTEIKNPPTPTWDHFNATLHDFGPSQIVSVCVPWALVIKRELEGRGSVSVLERRADSFSDLSSIPDDDGSLCAMSIDGGSFCADPEANHDPDPECDIREAAYVNTAKPFWYTNKPDPGTVSNRVGMGEKVLDICSPSAGSQVVGFTPENRARINFSKYPRAGGLKKINPNVITYEAEDIFDCQNFNLGTITSPNSPGIAKHNGGRTYDST